jgi:hypothetical protein
VYVKFENSPATHPHGLPMGVWDSLNEVARAFKVRGWRADMFFNTYGLPKDVYVVEREWEDGGVVYGTQSFTQRDLRRIVWLETRSQSIDKTVSPNGHAHNPSSGQFSLNLF